MDIVSDLTQKELAAVLTQDEETCRTCAWHNNGYCAYYPPRVMPNGETYWPEVNEKFDFCSKWKSWEEQYGRD